MIEPSCFKLWRGIMTFSKLHSLILFVFSYRFECQTFSFLFLNRKYVNISEKVCRYPMCYIKNFIIIKRIKKYLNSTAKPFSTELHAIMPTDAVLLSYNYLSPKLVYFRSHCEANTRTIWNSNTVGKELQSTGVAPCK